MRKKEDKIGSNGTITFWPEHHQPIPNQCKGGELMVKGFAKGVVWWLCVGGEGGGGGEGLFLVSSQCFCLGGALLYLEGIFVQNR